MARQPSLLSSLPPARLKDPAAGSFRPFELELTGRGFVCLAGVDEAGRGCLAGPVVAAAVLLPPVTPELLAALAGVNDSKQLSAPQRDALFDKVLATCLSHGIGEASAAEVDQLNVLGATHLAMSRAVAQLSPPPDLLLIDGNQPIPVPVLRACWLLRTALTPAPAGPPPREAAPQPPQGSPGLPAQKTIVKGDSLCLSIAAASILAKVSRDRQMLQLARDYPGYGLEEHKGYPTATHKAAIVALGPSPIHRLTFRGVRSEAGDELPARGSETSAEVLSLFGRAPDPS